MGFPLRVVDMDHDIQNQIAYLQKNNARLEAAMEQANVRAEVTEERLESMLAQVNRMDGTILRMRADLPTKTDMEEILSTTMNKHIAKGFWAMLLLATGAVVTWFANHMTFK